MVPASTRKGHMEGLADGSCVARGQEGKRPERLKATGLMCDMT